MIKIILLTDSEIIKSHVETFNAECYIINEKCESGTYRIEILRKVEHKDDYILNIQGDEPFINIENVEIY